MEWYDSVHTLFREYNFLDFPLNIIDTLCYLPGSSVMIQFRDSTMMEKKTVYAQLSCQDIEYPPGFLEFLNRLKYFISKITQSKKFSRLYPNKGKMRN